MALKLASILHFFGFGSHEKGTKHSTKQEQFNIIR